MQSVPVSLLVTAALRMLLSRGALSCFLALLQIFQSGALGLLPQMIQSSCVCRPAPDVPVRGGPFGSFLQLILHSLRLLVPALPGRTHPGSLFPLSSLVLALIPLLSDVVARSLIVSRLAQADLGLADSPLMIVHSVRSCSCVRYCCLLPAPPSFSASGIPVLGGSPSSTDDPVRCGLRAVAFRLPLSRGPFCLPSCSSLDYPVRVCASSWPSGLLIAPVQGAAPQFFGPARDVAVQDTGLTPPDDPAGGCVPLGPGYSSPQRAFWLSPPAHPSFVAPAFSFLLHPGPFASSHLSCLSLHPSPH